ncbi:stage II sporulation protein R [Brevibacillus fluminis]|uniref:Stage II sporulation protein R n=1 Tax=Brevibacillus fluminis TaxID=511487 RepID=A0A3M8D2C3_9BACL|nr:stage II sporulation protein R [Brevibacillus fluminis]RNB82028.1 stage II sporulation protein R [Brevibacillus fluminis]
MKRFLLVVFSLVIATMCWEQQRSSANVLDNGPIPQESIRLRIIANSDSVTDQWLKREVRDAIVAQMNTWVKEIGSYDEARQVVAKRLPELQKLVDKTIKARGFSYPAVVDFGQVPFPTKLYGSYVYPAGNYEALRVRIGEAEGQNWWCVLFPPLCFIDMANGDAVAHAEEKSGAKSQQSASSNEPSSFEQKAGQEKMDDTYQSIDEERSLLRAERWMQPAELVHSEGETKAETTPETSEPRAANVELEAKTEPIATAMTVEQPAPKVEVRFFLWDKLAALF